VNAAFLLLALLGVLLLVAVNWLLGLIFLVITGIAYRALSGERIQRR
jgi:hypothetical protein